jgi:hypothetical protein
MVLLHVSLKAGNAKANYVSTGKSLSGSQNGIWGAGTDGLTSRNIVFWWWRPSLPSLAGLVGVYVSNVWDQAG